MYRSLSDQRERIGLMPKLNLLIVDDEPDTLEALEQGLQCEDYAITTATSRNDAINLIKSQNFDILLCDLKLKDGSGLDLLTYVQENNLPTSVVIMTAHGSVETAIESIRSGAHEYVLKPFRMADINRVIERLGENIYLRRENELLKKQLLDKPKMPHFVGISTRSKQVLNFAKQVAASRSTVLITGETGTGKEVVAEIIHYVSPRNNKPFVKINCGAIPNNLLEAELFGYERGAFTGALKQKKGKIELADMGTLFLDEIGDLAQEMQVKMLRILQNGEFERLGGTAILRVDVRIIAATNVNLAELVTEGQFREDLYYRLNVITLEMPPLRERLEDIPLLVQHFVDKYNQLNNKNIQGIHPSVLNQMRRYPWRGNIRELENMIERAVVLSKEKILKPYHFPSLEADQDGFESNVGFSVGMSLSELERAAIQRTLQKNNYDKNKTAMTLQIGLATLYRKIKEYGLEEV